ncbi:MAG TPA: TolC family protein, partial [Candidatus Hydrogenedentes bacterium]|nr:TolC family protein [Candidatus Hydrogenedentota bacterium]
MRKSLYLFLFSLLVLTPGCATFDGTRTREVDKDAFLAGLEERTAQELEKDTPLDLERCIAIALENNLAVKSADLDARLAKLNRDIAFANFLPTVTFEYTSTELNRAPASSIIAGMSTTMQDRIIRETTVQAQMPIFAPATWFLYAAHKRGEEIGVLAADYTRQMIALQVTGLYYQCLATLETRRTLESQR